VLGHFGLPRYMPVGSPDHSQDASFALAVWVGTIGGSALGTDPVPDTGGNAPAGNRILRVTAKRDGVMTLGGCNLRMVTSGDGTSIVLQPWFFDNTQNAWVKHGATVTITSATANAASIIIGNMAGAKFFVQIVTNTGVTALAYDVV
jgi:hypothetical protein